MKRTDTLNLLRNLKPALVQRFGVTELALFGSVARDQSRVIATWIFWWASMARRYFGVQFYLEDQLGCPVDLVTEKALRSELRHFIEKEAIHV